MMPPTLLDNPRFPRATRYSPEWLLASASGGANPLWLAEWLAETLELRPGMRVLDLGCGRAASSIFLAREFGVEVHAVDLWFTASENWRRIQDAGQEGRVTPLHCDARSLPFASGFFDAIVCIDAFVYFGTDALYLNYLANFVKPGGQIGVAGAGLTGDFSGPPPEHLRPMWSQDLWSLKSAPWWREHWERTGIVKIETADVLPDGWKLWLEWQQAVHGEVAETPVEITALQADAGRHLGYVRVVGRRNADVELMDYCWPDTLRAFPAAEYSSKALLRGEPTP
jgi:SAM-dependent methyltransferase